MLRPLAFLRIFDALSTLNVGRAYFGLSPLSVIRCITRL